MKVLYPPERMFFTLYDREKRSERKKREEREERGRGREERREEESKRARYLVLTETLSSDYLRLTIPMNKVLLFHIQRESTS